MRCLRQQGRPKSYPKTKEEEVEEEEEEEEEEADARSTLTTVSSTAMMSLVSSSSSSEVSHKQMGWSALDVFKSTTTAFSCLLGLVLSPSGASYLYTE